MGKYQRILAKLRFRKEYIELNRKCKVAFVGLFGSQNYGLDDEESDIDCVMVTMPSLDELIGGKPDVKTLTSAEFSPDASDDGQMKLMDIRDFAKQLENGSFVNLETLFSDYIIVDDSFKDFYNCRNKIYKRYLWNYQNAVYGAVGNILRDYKRVKSSDDDSKDELRQSKRMYEILRLENFYAQLMNKSDIPAEYRPEFYITCLAERSLLGNIKYGLKDSGEFLEMAELISPPEAKAPDAPESFDVVLCANDAVKKYIMYRDFDQDCGAKSCADCAK